jgi:Zn-dependent protease with chaperone function
VTTAIETPRVRLIDISPVTWEHPTDRAALQTLRAVPGFDDALRKVVGFIGERGMRLLFQANAVRVGPRQFPWLDATYTDVLSTLDVPERPELFVTQTPLVNAGAYGMDKPFIVINSGTLRLLDEPGVRTILGHEVGHILSGHALYHTLLVLLLNVGLGFLPSLAGIALSPIRAALLEWYRKSELSCDRAGLLACQEPEAAMRVFLSLAGGGSREETSLDAFLAQAREYDASTGTVDWAFKLLNSLGQQHPFATLRAAALVKWIEEGHYDRILRGEYTRRGDEGAYRPQTASEVSERYARDAKAAVGDVVSSAKRAAQAIADTVKKPPR